MVATAAPIVVPSAVARAATAHRESVLRAATARRVEIEARVLIVRKASVVRAATALKATAPHALIARRATGRHAHRESAPRDRREIGQRVRSLGLNQVVNARRAAA